MEYKEIQVQRSPLITLLSALLLTAVAQCSYADQQVIDEGERRARSAGAALVGKPAPNAVLTSIDGERIDLAQLYGKKPVYLKFWATWCVPCRQQMPGFEAIEQSLGEQIEVIAVNTGFSDDAESIRAYRKELGLSMPVVVDDGSLAAALNLRVTPMHVLIGRDGRIAYIGHLDDAPLHAALAELLKNEAAEKTADTGSAEAIPTFKVGDKVQGLQATTLDQHLINLDEPAGKPRALVFFAPWCESYLEQSRPQTSQACKRVRETVDELTASSDAEWLGVSSGLWVSREDLQEYADTSKPNLPLALDESDALFRAFAIRDIPSVVLLDRQGRVKRILGPQDTQLKEALHELSAR
ncbi:histidinol-phosphatase [Pseudomonas daroniae]|nr:histidinol-phosphatase [Pseudomonas daroniae]